MKEKYLLQNKQQNSFKYSVNSSIKLNLFSKVSQVQTILVKEISRPDGLSAIWCSV